MSEVADFTPSSFREVHGNVEAFLLTDELALSVLGGKSSLPWGLRHGSASWHPERKTVSHFSVRIGDGWAAELGDWVIRRPNGKMEACRPNEFAAQFDACVVPHPPEPRAAREWDQETMDYYEHLEAQVGRARFYLNALPGEKIDEVAKRVREVLPKPPQAQADGFRYCRRIQQGDSVIWRSPVNADRPCEYRRGSGAWSDGGATTWSYLMSWPHPCTETTADGTPLEGRAG